MARTQARLASNTNLRSEVRLASSHLLTGRIRDGDGQKLSPTHARKGSVRYRYYVSRAALTGGASSTGTIRIPAGELEQQVLGALRSTVPGPKQPDGDAELVALHLNCVTVQEDHLTIRLMADREPITVPWSPPNPQRRREIIVPPGREGATLRPMKLEDRARILRAIATGRAWMDELTNARIASPAAIASREILSERSVRMTLSLAHLAPSIVKAVIDGRLPRGIAIRDLADLSPVWTEQERALGM
jgi:hypothetical protein